MASSKQTEETWNVVSEPRTKIVFDTIGDEWEGFYEGPETIIDPNTDQEMEYLNFRDATGEAFTISAGYDLKRAFERVAQGTYSKIILVNTVPSKKGNDVKLHKVLTRS